MRINGKMGDGDNSNNRWCGSCNVHHGVIYACVHYSEPLLKEIRKDKRDIERKLNNSVWIEKQTDNGVPIEVLDTLRAFV